MAAIASAASGDWSAGATWVGGVAPTILDTVTITHNVTLDINTAEAISVVINSGGQLSAHASNNMQLTLQAGITINNGGHLNFDVRSSYRTAFFRLNNLNSNTDANASIVANSGGLVTMRGLVKARWARTVGALVVGDTSATIDDVTGWQVGDIIMFGQTSGHTPVAQVDEVVITSIVGNVVSWTGGLVYAHADGCYVGNFSSNVRFGPANPNGTRHGTMRLIGAGVRVLTDVMLDRTQGGFSYSSITFYGVNGPDITYERNAHYRLSGQLFFDLVSSVITRKFCVYSQPVGSTGWLMYSHNNGWFGDEEDAVFIDVGQGLHQSGPGGYRLIRCKISTLSTYIFDVPAGNVDFIDCDIWSVANVIGSATYRGLCVFENCRFGTQFGGNTIAAQPFAVSVNVICRDCQFASNFNAASPFAFNSQTWQINFDSVRRFIIANRNNDPLLQDQFQTGGKLSRNANAILFEPKSVTRVVWEEFFVPAASGALATFSARFTRSDAAHVVTLTISGMGITPVTTTLSGAGGVGTPVFASVSAVQNSGSNGVLKVRVEVKGATTGTVVMDDWACPPPVAVNTGNGEWWSEGRPPFVTANFVTPADTWNYLRSAANQAGSLGQALTELFRIHGLEPGSPLTVTPTARSAGGISQSVNESGGNVTVTRT